VRIGRCPPIDIVLAEVETTEMSLAILGLRRATSSAVCRKAVDMIGEELLASLALYPLSAENNSSVNNRWQYRRSHACLCSFTS
jgi:hypothetical protein